jgi:S1-C subfamily serine protease
MGKACNDARPLGAMTKIILLALGLGACAPQLEAAPSPPPPRAVATFAAPTIAADGAAHLGTREIASRASGYTVFIRSGRAYGAGVVFDRAGRLLTCDHVVMEPEEIAVYFEGRPVPIRAEVVDRDAGLDLAVLQLDGELPEGVVPANEHGIDGVTGLRRGDEVYAMGAPRKMLFSFQRGVVSFDARPFEALYYLQTDLAMNPGSSGGPVLDERGQLVGIASFILRGGEGLSFALPIDYALRRFESLDAAPTEARQARLAAFESWLGTHTAERSEETSRPAADILH